MAKRERKICYRSFFKYFMIGFLCLLGFGEIIDKICSYKLCTVNAGNIHLGLVHISYFPSDTYSNQGIQAGLNKAAGI